jgi:hypothetical protein
VNCLLLGLIRDELAIFAGQTPDALKTPATPPWLSLWPFAATASAMSRSAFSCPQQHVSVNCLLLGLIRDELAIFAGQTPDALKTPATPSWLI